MAQSVRQDRLNKEGARNQLLRRVDWRFLLPEPAPRSIVCYAGGLLFDAVAEIGEDVLDGRAASAGPGGVHDLAVAVDPDPSALQSAWRALRPGGSFYSEWHGPGIHPAQIRRRLAAAGFSAVACYWAWPQPDRNPAVWLPLDAPEAIRFYQSQRMASTAGAERALRHGQWLCWRAASRTGMLGTISVVAQKANPAMGPHDSVPLPAVLATLRTRWPAWGLGDPPGRLSWVLLTGGYRSINKIAGLVFAADEPHPRLAVKLPRVPDSITALREEAAQLQAVHATRPGGVPGAPRALFSAEREPVPFFGQTVHAGQPYWRLLRRENYRPLALQATAWLTTLAGRKPPSPRAHWWERLVAPQLRNFDGMFGAEGPQLRSECAAILETLPALPIVCEQRDFAPWNVMIGDDGELIVLDWESAELRGLPAMDLNYLLAHMVLFVDGIPVHGELDLPRIRQAYRASLDPSTFAGGVYHECMALYARRTGVDEAALRPLRLLTWLTHAQTKYGYLAASEGQGAAGAAFRRSLKACLLEEELRGARPAIRTPVEVNP